MKRTIRYITSITLMLGACTGVNITPDVSATQACRDRGYDDATINAIFIAFEGATTLPETKRTNGPSYPPTL